MEFQTKIPLRSYQHKIDYDSKIVSLGSCFAVNIAQKFKEFQFQVTSNPFGILFHPQALEKILDYAVSNYVFAERDVFCLDGVWSCFDAHSDLNQLEQSDCIDHLNAALGNLRFDLQQATHVVLTLGTAWGYYYKATQALVANCHKVPQAQFDKKIMSYQEVWAAYERISALLLELNPQLHIIYTISPVRHIKDGFVENQRSKAILIAALHEFLEDKQAKQWYFPSYEIIMDELRDYRFYAADMLHPSPVAIQYIWNRWTQNMMDEAVLPVMKKVSEVQSGLNHRPFNPTSEKHGMFLDNLAGKIDDLLERFPFMNFRP
ncbi:GSCFA domain-containing protein [Flavobacterium sp. JP2137]|uniref:GSCFA domain-containing protein n=1 Tax=Flavobacterium sp. JP2137 TaxID=3414510 RepID=UPI003D2FDE00